MVRDILGSGLLAAVFSARRPRGSGIGLFDALKALIGGRAACALEREQRKTLQAALARPHPEDEVIEHSLDGRVRVVRGRAPGADRTR